MVRYVKAASSNKKSEKDFLDDWVYNTAFPLPSGWDATAGGTLDRPEIILKYSGEDDMPSVTISTEEIDDQICFTPHLEFPDIDFESGMFADHIQYVLKQWAELGKAMTTIIKCVLPATGLREQYQDYIDEE